MTTLFLLLGNSPKLVLTNGSSSCSCRFQPEFVQIYCYRWGPCQNWKHRFECSVRNFRFAALDKLFRHGLAWVSSSSLGLMMNWHNSTFSSMKRLVYGILLTTFWTFKFRLYQNSEAWGCKSQCWEDLTRLEGFPRVQSTERSLLQGLVPTNFCALKGKRKQLTRLRKCHFKQSFGV